jgi:hypothetical protein
LQLDVFEIGRERASRQPLYTFYNYRARLNLPDRLENVGKEIPFILVRAMLSPDTKWLAWRPCGQQVDRISVGAKGDTANVTAVQPAVTRA